MSRRKLPESITIDGKIYVQQMEVLSPKPKRVREKKLTDKELFLQPAQEVMQEAPPEGYSREEGLAAIHEKMKNILTLDDFKLSKKGETNFEINADFTITKLRKELGIVADWRDAGKGVWKLAKYA